LINKNCIKN